MSLGKAPLVRKIDKFQLSKRVEYFNFVFTLLLRGAKRLRTERRCFVSPYACLERDRLPPCWTRKPFKTKLSPIFVHHLIWENFFSTGQSAATVHASALLPPIEESLLADLDEDACSRCGIAIVWLLTSPEN